MRCYALFKRETGELDFVVIERETWSEGQKALTEMIQQSDEILLTFGDTGLANLRNLLENPRSTIGLRRVSETLRTPESQGWTIPPPVKNTPH